MHAWQRVQRCVMRACGCRAWRPGTSAHHGRQLGAPVGPHDVKEDVSNLARVALQVVLAVARRRQRQRRGRRQRRGLRCGGLCAANQHASAQLRRRRRRCRQLRCARLLVLQLQRLQLPQRAGRRRVAAALRSTSLCGRAAIRRQQQVVLAGVHRGLPQ